MAKMRHYLNEDDFALVQRGLSTQHSLVMDHGTWSAAHGYDKIARFCFREASRITALMQRLHEEHDD